MTALACLIALAQAPAEAAGEAVPFAETPFGRYVLGDPAPRLVAYAPTNHAPGVPGSADRLTTDSIRADLEALRSGFDGLILYGADEKIDARVCEEAEKLGYRAIVFGVWQPQNSAELDVVSDVAAKTKLAAAVCIGNEGLLFDRYSEADVTTAAERLRQSLPRTIPFTTTEPRYKSNDKFVQEFGDFMLPNIHPYYDKPDFGAEEAAAWVHEQAAVLAEASGKYVVVKETGYPRDENRDAGFQAQFWKTYRSLERPGDAAFGAAAFEGFDAPWKAAESGRPVEGEWGLMKVDRTPYPAFEAWAEPVE